jgi:glycosyltransferase involved in cell wall biosynthesis
MSSHLDQLDARHDGVTPVRNILLIGGTFSGATESLRGALEAKGCSVEHVRASLRELRARPLHIAAMALEAMARRGPSFKRFLFRTHAANRSFGLANDRVVAARAHLDLVIQIGTPFKTYRRPGVRYALFTDHTNLLSKQLPDFGFEFPQRDVPRVWNKIERENLLQQDHIFVMGSHVRQSMVNDYGVRAERVVVVGGGPNVDVDIERDGARKPPEGKNILFVGLEAERKGLPTLLQAFANVRRSHPTAALHIVGIDGTSAENVIYHGRQRGAALKQHFYAAQIFAMPSLREPFGIVFLEAMWSKAVCIGTNLGAMPEIIQHGLVIEPNDVAALSTAIDTLLSSRPLMQELAERAYAEARARWSWACAAQRILDAVNRAG